MTILPQGCSGLPTCQLVLPDLKVLEMGQIPDGGGDWPRQLVSGENNVLQVGHVPNVGRDVSCQAVVVEVEHLQTRKDRRNESVQIPANGVV